MVTTAYDAAGRLSGVTGRKAGEADRSYASSLAYAAHGATSELKLGNSLWEHTAYNSRLQPVEIGLGTAATNSSVLRLDYSYGVRVSSTLDATKNNGNVERQTITAPGLQLRQSYTYD